MDTTHRLKIKIGEHEFEAEGFPEDVRAQFEVFKELIAKAPAPAPAKPGDLESGGKPDLSITDTMLDKIMRVEGRVVSLTARPNSVDDALLLLIYGQRVLRKVEAVTGSELTDGLSQTGGLDVARIDRRLEKAAAEVTTIGAHRAKRYRLTNTGMAKARSLAAELIAKVA